MGAIVSSSEGRVWRNNDVGTNTESGESPGKGRSVGAIPRSEQGKTLPFVSELEKLADSCCTDESTPQAVTSMSHEDLSPL